MFILFTPSLFVKTTEPLLDLAFEPFLALY